MSFRDLEMDGHYDSFSFVWTKAVFPGQVQQPITDFTGPWDDSMLHVCKQPLSSVTLNVIPPEGL